MKVKFRILSFSLLALGILCNKCFLSFALAEETLLSLTIPSQSTNVVFNQSLIHADLSAQSTIEIKGDAANPRTEIFSLSSLDVSQAVYAIKGEIAYESVSGLGFLELNNIFDDGNSYFSRTLQNAGPMRSFTGTSDWRPFLLPFYRNNIGSMTEIKIGSPKELKLIAELPSGGTLRLRNMQLVQYGPQEDPFANPNDWMTQRQFNSALATGGTAVGLLGGLIAILSALGRGRNLVIAALKGFIVLGVVLLFYSGYAFLQHQPPNLIVPLAGIGLLLIVIASINIPKLKTHFLDMEQRTMEADAA